MKSKTTPQGSARRGKKSANAAKTRATLFDKRVGGTDIFIEVALTESGVRFSGHDIGEAAEESFGRGDHEYWLTVPKEHFPLLVLALIEDRFHGDGTVISKMQSLLKSRGIPSRFSSY